MTFGNGRSSDGKHKAERRTFPAFGFNPNPAIVAIHNAPADGQSNSRPREFIVGMEAFEQPKNLILVFGLNTNAVVAYRESPVAILALHSDTHDRRPLQTAAV